MQWIDLSSELCFTKRVIPWPKRTISKLSQTHLSSMSKMVVSQKWKNRKELDRIIEMVAAPG